MSDKPWHETAAELLAKATPGPWKAKPDPDDGKKCLGIVAGKYERDIVQTDSGCYPPNWKDAQLIAAAPALLKAALEEREELSELLAECKGFIGDQNDSYAQSLWRRLP